MKKIAAVLLVAGFSASYAFGGVVSFDPEKAQVTLGGDTVVEFVVSVANDAGGSFTNADLIMGSDDLQILSFVYSQAAIDAFGFFITNPPVRSSAFYADSLGIGGFAPGGLNSGFVLGTLTVDADGLGEGSYDVMVSAERDGSFSNAGNEPISGMGTVNVVPEPATISLMGLAALGLIRRRKTA